MYERPVSSLDLLPTALAAAAASPPAGAKLDGVELVRGNEVHPYHLLRYEHAIFSRAAIEKLQASLKATLPKRLKDSEPASVAPRRKRGRRKAAEVA